MNLVCTSGQGSVQTLEVLAHTYHRQHKRHIVSLAFPGTRAKSSPMVL